MVRGAVSPDPPAPAAVDLVLTSGTYTVVITIEGNVDTNGNGV